MHPHVWYAFLYTWSDMLAKALQPLSLFAQNGSLFAQNGSLLAQNGSLFAQNGSLFAQNSSSCMTSAVRTSLSDDKQRRWISLAQSKQTRLPTSGGRKSHIGGLDWRRQQGKYLVPSPLGVAVQVDGNLDLIRADFAGDVTNRPGRDIQEVLCFPLYSLPPLWPICAICMTGK